MLFFGLQAFVHLLATQSPHFLPLSEYECDVVGIVGSNTGKDWCGGWELDWGAIEGWLVEDILTFKVPENTLVRYS